MKLTFLAVVVVAGTAAVGDLYGTSTASAATPLAVAVATVAAPAVALDTVTLRIEGMDCGGCTIATRKVLERLDGVSTAHVSYEEKRAVVTYDPRRVTIQQMIAAVATLKYTATVVTPATKS